MNDTQEYTRTYTLTGADAWTALPEPVEDSGSWILTKPKKQHYTNRDALARRRAKQIAKASKKRNRN